MHITMEHPILLLCMIPILAACFYFAGSLRIKDKQRRLAMIGMRLAIFMLLILAATGISVTMRHAMTATIYLVDVSDSMSGSTKEMASFVRDAISKIPEEEMAGVVAFGYDSRVESFVSKGQSFAEFQTAPIRTATDFEQAIASAMALYPDGSGKRLVLVTDGQQNSGDIQTMVSTLTSNQVVVEVKKIDNATGEEVFVSDLSVPDKIRTGDTFSVQVEVESTVQTQAVLYLYAGDTLKKREEVSLQTGENQFVFKDTRKEEGYLTYRAVIEPNQDTMSINNEYVAYTQAEDGKGILLVEGREGAANQFEKVLQTANITYDKMASQIVVGSLANLNKYKSVVLVDVYVDDLPKKFLNNIETYVKDYAGGLVAIGGENSFALGGYKDTVLEKILPVNMDLEGEKEIPKMAVALVIDHSGSMSGGMGSYSKLELARESAVSALKNLRNTDEIGILAFDDTYSWVYKLGEASDKEAIEEEIYSISDGGGTSIFPALAAAEDALAKSDATLKHIILLTDGQDYFRDFDDLSTDMNNKKITLSTVAVGDDADKDLMQALAEAGKGRYYYTDASTDMPRIFAQEIFLSSRSYLVNREFTPAVVSDNGILKDVIGEGVPSMLGYVASSKKSLATSILVSDEDEPILTCWQYGLGKTVAFNSDVENIWTANYAAWEKYPALWRNIIDWTITDVDSDANNLSIKQDGATAKFIYTSDDYKEDTTVTVISTDSDGNVQECVLEATSPGKFEGTAVFSDTGVYSINAREESGGEVISVKNSAAAVQYSNEYRISSDTQVFDDFVESVNGNVIEQAEEVYNYKPQKVNKARNLTTFFLILAFVLFAWDVTARRLSLSLLTLTQNLLKKYGVKLEKQQRVKKAVKQQTVKTKQPDKKIETDVVKEPEEWTVQKISKEPGDSQEKVKKVSVKEVKKRKEVKKEEEPSMLDVSSLLNSKKERGKNL